MLDIVKSLSLESGALVVAILSAACGLAWARIVLSPLRWCLALGAPAVFAYALYWSPVWLGANSSEYWSWAPLMVGAWFLAGALASVLIVHLLRKSEGHKNVVPHV